MSNPADDAARATWLANEIDAAQETGDVIPVTDNDWDIIVAALRLYASVHKPGGMQ
jgi:hypothetical protein